MYTSLYIQFQSSLKNVLVPKSFTVSATFRRDGVEIFPIEF